MLSEDYRWRSEVVNTEDRFLSLQHEWKNFQQSLSDPHSSPFLSWDWLYLWWKIYKKPFWRLAIGVIRYDQKIVALFPFYIKSFPLRQLYFLGTGEPEVQEVATEYLDCLLEKTNPEIETKAAEWLNGFLKGIDVVVFQRMLKTAQILSVISLQDSYSSVKEIAHGHRYCLQLKNGWSPLLVQFNSNLKRKFRKYQDGMQARWVVEVCQDESELNDCMEQLIRLHELRWHSKGKAGAFVSSQFIAFHNRYAKYLLQQNQLFLATTKIDGQVVGCIYAMDINGVRYFYQAGFDPEIQHLAPGHLTHFAAIDSAMQKGFAGYDFMTGSIKGTYKSEYAQPGELLVSYIAVRRKWQMIYYRLWNKLISLINR